MEQFQQLNKTILHKILKKHDKQTCLKYVFFYPNIKFFVIIFCSAGTNFGKLLENYPYFIKNMSKSLYYILNVGFFFFICEFQNLPFTNILNK